MMTPGSGPRDGAVWNPVFSWRRAREPMVQKVAIVLITGAAFAMLLGFLHVRVVPAKPWAARKASVMMVPDNVEGRALTLRAQEGGPFPSRVEPADWADATSLEQSAMEAIRWKPPRYVPELRDLPEQAPPPVRAGVKGDPVLPALGRPSAMALKVPTAPPAPVLDALSGIAAAAIPEELPPFGHPVDQRLMAESWRFLLRLDATGNVAECVSLGGGDDRGPLLLEEWLRAVRFRPDLRQASRWIAVSVSFINRPAHGPDTD